MSLRPFDTDHAGTVAGWARSVEEAARWCGRAEWPFPAGVVAGWAAEDDVRAYGFHDGDVLVAYGELWLDDDEVELARLIVDPGHRGRGVGRALVTALADRARARRPAVFMRVHPDNAAALRCYAAAGFTRVDPEREREWNAAQPVAYVWLGA